jgi:hypothetical protein
MEERRRLERFDLTTPARLFVESESHQPRQLDLITRDISSSGAFLHCCSQPPTEGRRVKMELLISLDKLPQPLGSQGRAKVRVSGKVVRVDSSGIAVRFESRYKITSLGDGVRDFGRY